MKEPVVADLASRENREITGFFVAGWKQVRTNRDGGRYFALTLQDHTGQIEARMWEIDEAGEFEAGDVVKVLGDVSRFNEKLQIKVKKIRRAAPGEYELNDFVPQSERDIAEMWTELEGWAASLRDPDLKALVAAFLNDAVIAAALKQAPAAKSMHHAWMGGLLEHILSLMGLCELAAQHYPEVNRDLLLTGVMLHDVGKLRELSWGTSFDYTLEGQLLGHITIGIGMIEEKIAAIPNYPAAKRLLVEHLVLSHHGEYEFGSPKLPMTAEAMLLHYLDNLDAKMQTVRSELARAEASGRTGAEMTEWVRPLERQLLNTQSYLRSEGSHGFEESAQKPATQEPAKSASENGNRQEEKNHALPFED
ncbi:MAG: HD domain-containing protein [Acidobacteriaceae bacterium]|jgi:3'-5' exoribonuclease